LVVTSIERPPVPTGVDSNNIDFMEGNDFAGNCQIRKSFAANLFIEGSAARDRRTMHFQPGAVGRQLGGRHFHQRLNSRGRAPRFLALAVR
jgi:hypothetical protein